jgi:predicted glycoside hydrolase/deacetylase ChbG (UPF0249 family)
VTVAPRVVICADDYGMSDGVSAVIDDLLAAGALNATTCLVDGPAWPTSAGRLRVLSGERPNIAVGLHLELASPWVPARVALRRFETQWRRFEAHFGRAPDFVDGHRHVHLFPGPRAALFALLDGVQARPWLRQCRTTSRRPSLKRWVLDPLSAQFQTAARRRQQVVNPGFGGLRRFVASEDVAAIWRQDLSAMRDGGLLMTHPGPIDPSEPMSACRRQEAVLLQGGAVADALDACGLSMSTGRTPWDEAT